MINNRLLAPKPPVPALIPYEKQEREREGAYGVFVVRMLPCNVPLFIVLMLSLFKEVKQVCYHFFPQDSKKFFKRSDLARKEEEDYYRRCGYKVDDNNHFVSLSLTLSNTSKSLPFFSSVLSHV